MDSILENLLRLFLGGGFKSVFSNPIFEEVIPKLDDIICFSKRGWFNLKPAVRPRMYQQKHQLQHRYPILVASNGDW